MSSSGHNSKRPSKRSPHPYLSGNFAPVTAQWSPTPVASTGRIPKELHGGMYVRNGGNPSANSNLERESHWFDGDGMLSGVWFNRSPNDPLQPVAHFVNQFILTDVYLAALDNTTLRTPILPSISTLVNPASSLFYILWRIIRCVIVVIFSHLSGSARAITRISVANTSILFHDGRALATCESGPPIRVTLPGLETVGWFDGNSVKGEGSSPEPEEERATFGGKGLLSWMNEWTTGHPKVDNVTDEMVLFHCNFAPPYVHYSLLPTKDAEAKVTTPEAKSIVSAAVPGCSGGRLMHDFGVSRHHTVILDLPLSLDPKNLAWNKPAVLYQPEKPSRFGIFPRRNPELVRWFETNGCCIFHTANTWDELSHTGNVVSVNMLACRMTSASVVFSAANIEPPPHPNRKERTRSRPMSFFAKYDEEEDVHDLEKVSLDETSPLLGQPEAVSLSEEAGSSRVYHPPPMTHDEEEQCRLYYYRFSLDTTSSNTITHEFALSSISFEFPTISPDFQMAYARYVYGCSSSNETFGSALGKATKIDTMIRMDVETLLARARMSAPEPITGCVDNRTVDQILASNDPRDPIKAFKLPPNHYGQEAAFVPRKSNKTIESPDLTGSDGYLLFYVFNEDQLDEQGECPEDAKSELWVLDASDMQTVICKIQLAARVPYGLHGNWFTEDQINQQRSVAALRTALHDEGGTKFSHFRKALFGHFG